MRLRAYTGILALACLASPSAFANLGADFGFGSRNEALGGSTVGWTSGATAAYTNPAALSMALSSEAAEGNPNQRLSFVYGLIYVVDKFTPINNVVTENHYESDKLSVSDVDNSYRDTLGQYFGISYDLTPEFHHLTVGMVTFLPINQLAYMDTGETYVPEYVLYRARTQRPQFDIGLGADLGKGFHAGAGIHIGYGLTSNASVFLQTDPAKPSTMRFSTSLKPKVSPLFGILYQPIDALSFGAVGRTPLTSDNEMVLNSGAQVFGGFAALDFNFLATSALFYDPASIELGGSWAHSSFGRFYAQLNWELWQEFKPPALSIQNPTIGNCAPASSCGINLSGSNLPEFNYGNIVVPRFGEELTFGGTTFRLGYSYRPSIFKDLPVGAGNYLDPPKHMVNAGVGFHFDHFLNFESAWNLDLNFIYQILVTQHITKSAGDETGSTTGDPKVGSPSYNAGGNLIGGGVSLSLAF